MGIKSRLMEYRITRIKCCILLSIQIRNTLGKDQGFRVALRDVAANLKQAAATEKGFMESKWKPSIIVKVDGMIDEFSSPEGRKRLLENYINTDKAGEPWLIPADQFSVEQIKPLSLSDLAIADVVQLDKRTVAAILGVPPFVLGSGTLNPRRGIILFPLP